MKSYRPKLLREGTVAVRIRSEMLDVLSTGPGSDDEGGGCSGMDVMRCLDRAREVRRPMIGWCVVRSLDMRR